MILVSTCLTGLRTRYDGTACPQAGLAELVVAGKAFPICPEMLGGLAVPREPARIVGGSGRDVLDGRARVLTHAGKDVTECFLTGARAVLALARALGATEAVLKAGSPSCGAGGTGTAGSQADAVEGVTAALLARHGMTVRSSDH
jgi:uncharacterized protein YbbK (DUF523 family)